MGDKYTVDRVIGTKECKKCGYPVSVESYSIPKAQNRLSKHTSCLCPIEYNDNPVYCTSKDFTDPKFKVIMKPYPYKEGLNPLMRRMVK